MGQNIHKALEIWVSTKTTLNYRVIVERFSFLNGVFGSLIPIMKSSFYLTEKTN